MKKRKELPTVKEIPLLEAMETEKIRFEWMKEKRIRRWYGVYWLTAAMAALLCVMLLISEIGLGWVDFSSLGSGGGAQTPPTTDKSTEGLLLPTYQDKVDPFPNDPSEPPIQNVTPPLTEESLYAFDYSAVPKGEHPILPMDLSLAEYGVQYIHNDTGLQPNVEELLKRDWNDSESLEYLSTSSAPTVLIVHTHGTESYSDKGAISYKETDDDLTRSDDVSKNVVAVGRVIGEYLNERGISTVHCAIMHDRPQYKDAYARAEETIKQYLQVYPSIRLVIDVHRDAILKSTEEMVRPVALADGEAAAQMMFVVGSSWGGDNHPRWQQNLALALQLREAVNGEYKNLCRPVYLRSSTYNQEIAPYSLLVEVGAGGNCLDEAIRSARILADALVTLVPKL